VLKFDPIQSQQLVISSLDIWHFNLDRHNAILGIRSHLRLQAADCRRSPSIWQRRSRLQLRCAALGKLRAYSKGLNIVNVEKIPEFTPAAAKLWTAIPPETRKLLLSNVWCSKCKDETTNTNFTGAVKGGDLLLVGLCSICRGASQM
jgi:hypothetical protein